MSTRGSGLSALQKIVAKYQTKRHNIEAQLDAINNTLRQPKDNQRKGKEEERILTVIGVLI